MYKFLIQTNIPIFHHSIIPSGLHETCSTKNGVISISCTISETLIMLNYPFWPRFSFLIQFEIDTVRTGHLEPWQPTCKEGQIPERLCLSRKIQVEAV